MSRIKRDAGILVLVAILLGIAIYFAFPLSKTEVRWLDRLSKQADALPEDEDEFIASMRTKIDSSKVLLGEYGL